MSKLTGFISSLNLALSQTEGRVTDLQAIADKFGLIEEAASEFVIVYNSEFGLICGNTGVDGELVEFDDNTAWYTGG